ncbi:MAG: thiamine-monophosphate kinase [Lunatimonas sp.]|uniref:thiamine-phosphate kinase n=1 Tax=Lunatimonas sp. TaxID=2060141 RepID=UPI00263ABD21|nr:thiamine-phosphate kinase [Lunatimonas sp.]MCC5938917.1 thiamine-monophosphate kinase [Lunatimonas sp.]
MENNLEIDFIRKLAGVFPRHPLQVNGLMEADAEIIRCNGEYLVLKTDGIHEEITLGLYTDPFLIGWMTVIAPLSDMAAVGAVPWGLLLSLQATKHRQECWETALQKGISAACSFYGVYVLGGDTSFADGFSISATAIGHIKTGRPLMRSGLAPDDHVYTTSLAGAGNAFAYARFFDASVDLRYQPFARLKESKTIRGFASACMDSSDGLLPALAVLCEINHIGCRLEVPVIDLLIDEALTVQRHADLPEWILLAGPHGDYELVFTVSEALNAPFLKACVIDEWAPVYLGRITAEPYLSFDTDGLRVQCQPATIPNLYAGAEGNLSNYLERLYAQHTSWCSQK